MGSAVFLQLAARAPGVVTSTAVIAGFQSVDEDGATAGCGGSIQEIRKEANPYTGRPQGAACSIYQSAIPLFATSSTVRGGSCDVALCCRTVKALVWTLMISLSGTLAPLFVDWNKMRPAGQTAPLVAPLSTLMGRPRAQGTGERV